MLFLVGPGRRAEPRLRDDVRRRTRHRRIGRARRGSASGRRRRWSRSCAIGPLVGASIASAGMQILTPRCCSRFGDDGHVDASAARRPRRLRGSLVRERPSRKNRARQWSRARQRFAARTNARSDSSAGSLSAPFARLLDLGRDAASVRLFEAAVIPAISAEAREALEAVAEARSPSRWTPRRSSARGEPSGRRPRARRIPRKTAKPGITMKSAGNAGPSRWTMLREADDEQRRDGDDDRAGEGEAANQRTTMTRSDEADTPTRMKRIEPGPSKPLEDSTEGASDQTKVPDARHSLDDGPSRPKAKANLGLGAHVARLGVATGGACRRVESHRVIRPCTWSRRRDLDEHEVVDVSPKGPSRRARLARPHEAALAERKCQAGFRHLSSTEKAVKKIPPSKQEHAEPRPRVEVLRRVARRMRIERDEHGDEQARGAERDTESERGQNAAGSKTSAPIFRAPGSHRVERMTFTRTANPAPPRGRTESVWSVPTVGPAEPVSRRRAGPPGPKPLYLFGVMFRFARRSASVPNFASRFTCARYC